MKTTLIDLFTSKKFLAALSAIVIYGAGRFGLALDPAALDRIFAALLVYVGAQGIADQGKSAAQIGDARSATFGAAPSGLETGAALRAWTGAPPGRVRTGALLMLAAIAAGVLVAGVALSGCATASRIGTVAKGSAIECGKIAAQPVLELAADLGVQAALDALNLGEVDVPGLEARAVTEGLEIAGCAALRFAERWHVSAPKSQGLLARVDPSAALLARLRARYGATWAP